MGNVMLWDIFWTSVHDVGRIAITAVVGYAVLVFYIRIFGKRTTSRMNNFDWIVTVSVGSIFASMVILESVSMVNGLVAIGLLLCLQFALTFTTSRWAWARTLFLSPPRLLYFDGKFKRDAMRSERVSEAEMISAIRESGAGSLEETLAVVLESDADLSVVKEGETGNLETVEPVQGYDQVHSDGEKPDNTQ